MTGLAYKYSCEVSRGTYHRESDEKAGDNRPKEEAIVPDGLQYTEWTLEFVGVEVEERATEVLNLPSCNQNQKRQHGENSRASAEDCLASIVVPSVAVNAEITTACSVDDNGKCQKTERTTEGTTTVYVSVAPFFLKVGSKNDLGVGLTLHLLYEFVDYQFLGEDSDTKAMRRSQHNVRCFLFHTQAKGKE